MKNLEIEKKKAKKEFLFLAIAIIVYEFLFQVVVLGVDFMEMTVLLLGFRESRQPIWYITVGLH